MDATSSRAAARRRRRFIARALTSGALASIAASMIGTRPAAAGCGSRCPGYISVDLDGSGSLVENIDAHVGSMVKDWPIQTIFVQDANIYRLRAKMTYADFCSSSCGGSEKRAWTRNADNPSQSPGWLYSDSDGGQKSTFTEYHYRAYADNSGYSNPDEANYSINLGFWVVASYHEDILEGTAYQQFGWSQDVRDYVFDSLKASGFSAVRDAWDLKHQGFFWSGLKNGAGQEQELWLSNGKADKIFIHP